MVHRLLMALTVAAAAIAAVPAMPQSVDETCDRQARKESGLRGRAPSPERRIGRATIGIHGSAGFGISSGSSYTAAPPFAGQAALERRRRKAEEKYLQVYRDCIGSE